MESFQTPFIVCLRTGALQEQDEPAPLELLGALEQNPDTETEQDPITTPPTSCSRLQHQPPIFINISFAFAHRHITVATINALLAVSHILAMFSYVLFMLHFEKQKQSNYFTIQAQHLRPNYYKWFHSFTI